jgi:hypothetical protein
MLIILTCLTTNASVPPSSELDVYFPLEIGAQWIYSNRLLGLHQQSVTSYDEARKGYVLEIKGRAEGRQQSVIQKLGDKIEKIGTIGQNGVYKPIVPPQTILAAPLKKGSSWEYNDSVIGKQECKVIGFISMKGIAGKYSKVLKIERSASATAGKEKAKQSWKSILYFAPNVGLIKEESVAKDGRTTVVMELASYHPAGKRKR